MHNPLVSVVIITRDREKELQRCIKSILNNTYKNIEIIIFDNGSQTSSRIIQIFLSSLKYNFDINIKYIKSPPKGFAEMRRIAVDNSIGEIIMNIDDDCVAEKHVIPQIIKRFMSDETIGIVGGEMTNVGFKGKEKFKGTGRIGKNGRYEVVRDPKDAEVFGSANMSIRREAFDEVGGYDSFFSGGLEEADITLRIKKKGYKVVYEPSVKITHFHSPTRIRSKWRNLNILRLYLFFKHYMPKNFIQWFKFFKLELSILIENINEAMPKFGFTLENKNHRVLISIFQNKHNFLKYLKKSCNIFLELSKIISSRVIIPCLIYKAYKVRSSEK